MKYICLLISLFASVLSPLVSNAGFLGLIDNGNDTVSDITTGLMWQQKPLSLKPSYPSSLTYCRNLSLAGHEDWRMPQVREALSIIDYRRADPALSSPIIFPNPDDQNGKFWAHSTDSATTRVRTIDTSEGRVSDVLNVFSSGIAQIRCVRDI